MTTPLTHGTIDNPSESGTTRCGLAYDAALAAGGKA